MSLFRNALQWKNMLQANTLKILFAVKVGLAGGAVYYLADQGVWKESTETTKLFDRITSAVHPYVLEAKSQLPIEIPDLPSTHKVSYLTKQYWNQGVASAFTYVGELPSHVGSWTSRGIEAVKRNEEIKKFFDSLTTTAPSNVSEK